MNYEKKDIEELITEASNLLQPIIQPQEGVFFDNMGYRNTMRWLKRKLDASMKKNGISIHVSNTTTQINPKFKDLCISLRELTISHAAQGNYGLELEACVELTDLLSGLEHE